MTAVLERKWTAPATCAPQLVRWLASRMRRDPQHAAGWVVSVYYDTPEWRLLREKEDSDYLKTKVRVRWYEDDAGALLSPDAFLEVKSKRGGARTKARLVTSEPATLLQALPLTDQRWARLPDAARRAGALLPTPLTPVFTVRYRRRRFIDALTRSRVSLSYLEIYQELVPLAAEYARTNTDDGDKQDPGSDQQDGGLDHLSDAVR